MFFPPVHTVSCSCGRFFEQHPTRIEDTEDTHLYIILENIRTGKCRCFRDIDPFNPPVAAHLLASKRLLHAAAASGYTSSKVVQFLLNNKVEVNAVSIV